MFYMHYYVILFYFIFGTNLLTQSPVSVSVFSLFWVSQKRNAKRSPNGIKLYKDFSWTRRHLGDLEFKSEELWGVHKGGGRAQGVGCTPYLVGPSVTPWSRYSSYIFTYIPKPPEASTKTLFHRCNLLFPWDPILGPFPALRPRGIWSQRASTPTLLPFRWCVSSLPLTYGSIASS